MIAILAKILVFIILIFILWFIIMIYVLVLWNLFWLPLDPLFTNFMFLLPSEFVYIFTNWGLDYLAPFFYFSFKSLICSIFKCTLLPISYRSSQLETTYKKFSTNFWGVESSIYNSFCCSLFYFLIFYLFYVILINQKIYSIYIDPILFSKAPDPYRKKYKKELTILPTILEVPENPNPLDPENIFGLQ